MKEKIIFKVETALSIFLLSHWNQSKIAFSYLLTTLRVLRKQLLVKWEFWNLIGDFLIGKIMQKQEIMCFFFF